MTLLTFEIGSRGQVTEQNKSRKHIPSEQYKTKNKTSVLEPEVKPLCWSADYIAVQSLSGIISCPGRSIPLVVPGYLTIHSPGSAWISHRGRAIF